MPVPTNVEQLRSQLGLTVYLRNFVEDDSIIAAPLTDHLREKSLLVETLTENADRLAREISNDVRSHQIHRANSLVLAFPSWNDPSVLHTDTSVLGVVPVLT